MMRGRSQHCQGGLLEGIDFIGDMALAIGSSRVTIFMHRSTDDIFACRALVHAPAASAVPLTFDACDA
jgi:hypothetical protein